MTQLAPAHKTLLRLLAEDAAREYLTSLKQQNQDDARERTDQELPKKSANG